MANEGFLHLERLQYHFLIFILDYDYLLVVTTALDRSNLDAGEGAVAWSLFL